MSRRIASISNLLELLESGIVTITNVQCRTKAFADIEEIDDITPTEFVESLQYLDKTKLFRDGIDFCYEFMSKNSVRIECGMKNLYMDEYFYADCTLKDGVSVTDVEEKLRETIFHKFDKGITA